MKSRIMNYALLAGTVSLLFTSCIKDDVKDTTTEGSTTVKLLQAPENKFFFEPFTEVRTLHLFSLRKDANSESELNKPLAVKVQPNTTLIANYNAANNANFEILPDSLYTLDPGNPKVGGIYEMNMTASQFAKEFTIKLNGSKWNLSKKYALGFTISDAGGKAIPDGKKDILVLISIKNKWDGVYVATGTLVDNYIPTLTGIYDDPGGFGEDVLYSLQTVSATECVVVSATYQGIPCIPIWDLNAQDWSYYGNFGIIVTFDPATDKVTKVINYYGQPAPNTRSANLDPSGVNAYDEASKTVKIKYFMMQPSVIPDPPHIRVKIDEEWKFVRAR
ncbi:DUF1735 domain-containing protein [Pseudoflavitalea sp. X16]|uniref:BT_3987 domain-containing protein n=1 Tax=Paraflavitalea devenefica TaxID=2716334 RepID=UPI00142070F2|nr:DUF1735 domain-containing protein [Paraflavitalea devenefica]NII29904.1 DUF1735 domain-containing protein [Paraflavitalea devenefica]